MSKLSTRYQRSANDKENRILKQWHSAAGYADIFFAQTVEDAFKTLKWSIAEKINLCAGEGFALSFYDERIYDYYKNLMNYYNATVSLYEESSAGLSLFRIKGKKADEILSGIYSVALSRIRQFEENGGQLSEQGSESEIPGLRNNPIKIEKKMLISKAIKAFSEAFDIAAFRLKSELYAELLFEVRRKFTALGAGAVDYDGLGNGIVPELYAKIAEKCFKRFFAMYLEAVKSAEHSLNDFFGRHAAAYYSELLLNEHEILCDLATVQVSALEEESAALSEDAREAINAIISSILQAHQKLSGDVAEMRSFFSGEPVKDESEPRISAALEDFDEFSESLWETALKDNRKPALEEAKEGFIGRLSEMKEAFLKDFNKAVVFWLSAKDLEKSFTGDILTRYGALCKMAAEIRGMFCGIYEYYQSNAALSIGDSNDGKIVKGIAETVEIKAQSLREAIQAFETEMKEIMKRSSGAPPIQSQAQAAEINEMAEETFIALTNELSELYKDDRRALSTVKRRLSFRDENECFAGFIEKLVRPFEKSLEDAEIKIMRFTKEQILFEVSTFEEILNYSVSRLRESADESVKAFVGFIDESTRNLDRILGENGISRIKPEPHDLFNGKEHEVLMAEKHDDFKKGEIVKLMNSGFRRGGIVIMRANVIASK